MKINPKDIEEIERNSKEELDLEELKATVKEYPLYEKEIFRLFNITSLEHLPKHLISRILKRVQQCISYNKKAEDQKGVTP